MSYHRPQWTGKPLVYGDGRNDSEFSECPSCLGFHAASNLGCNGKREPCDEQCPYALGEIRCHRPANHIGEHQALSSVMRVAWEHLGLSAVRIRRLDEGGEPTGPAFTTRGVVTMRTPCP